MSEGSREKRDSEGYNWISAPPPPGFPVKISTVNSDSHDAEAAPVGRGS